VSGSAGASSPTRMAVRTLGVMPNFGGNGIVLSRGAVRNLLELHT
jgi:hypothetical protein